MTNKNTKKRVPKHVWVRANIVRTAIKTRKNEVRRCSRCDGEGYQEREDWVVTDDYGSRECFSCKGSGTAAPRRYADPMKVRYAVAFRLLPAVEQGDIEKIAKEEVEARNDIYWPILKDVFSRAQNAAERIAGY